MVASIIAPNPIPKALGADRYVGGGGIDIFMRGDPHSLQCLLSLGFSVPQLGQNIVQDWILSR